MSSPYSPRQSLDGDGVNDSIPNDETLWARYLTLAEKTDDQFVKDLKGISDGILVFTGLFAAVVAQFVSQTYPLLTQDPSDQSTAILLQISQQLAGNANGSFVPPSGSDSDFVPPAYAVRMNSLWFLSLILSIFAAFMATLIQQWARTYQRDIQQPGSFVERGLMHTCLYAGIKRSGLTYSVDLVAIVLNIAVVLFGIGLAELVQSLNTTVSNVVVISLYVFLGIYGACSIAPVLIPECPYATPLTPLFRLLAAVLSYLFCVLYADRLSDFFKIDVYSITGTVFKTILSRRQQLYIQSRLRSPFRFEHVAGLLIQNLSTASDVRGLFAILPSFLDSPLMRGKDREAWRILFRQKLHYALSWLLFYFQNNDTTIKDGHMELLGSYTRDLVSQSKRADVGIQQLSTAWTRYASTRPSKPTTPHTTFVAECALAAMRARVGSYDDPAHVTRSNMITGRKVRVYHPEGDVARRCASTRAELFSLAHLGLGAIEPAHPEERSGHASVHLPFYAFVALLRGAARAGRGMQTVPEGVKAMCVEEAQKLADLVTANGVPGPESAARVRLNSFVDPVGVRLGIGGDGSGPSAAGVGSRKYRVVQMADDPHADDYELLLERIPGLRGPVQQVVNAFQNVGVPRQVTEKSPVWSRGGILARAAREVQRFSLRTDAGSAVGGIPLLPVGKVDDRESGDALDV